MSPLIAIIICLVVLLVIDVAAFSTKMSAPSSPTSSRLFSSPVKISAMDSSINVVNNNDNDEDDVTCYVTNDEEIVTEGEKPNIVCTSEPEEYAWFNGVDPKAMRKTDGTQEGTDSCVEVESYMGKPEWECK